MADNDPGWLVAGGWWLVAAGGGRWQHARPFYFWSAFTSPGTDIPATAGLWALAAFYDIALH